MICAIPAVTLVRAIINSQSAEAHLALFSRIFEIAEADTGSKVNFHYLHGRGIDVITADEHLGQAKGSKPSNQTLAF
jgi:hypothetical protein